MTLHEHFPDIVAKWRVRIIATDISEPILARAREGTFSDLEVGRGLPPRLRDAYFRPLQGRWSIVQECRRLVEFRPFNLIGSWPMLPPCDVIFLQRDALFRRAHAGGARRRRCGGCSSRMARYFSEVPRR